MRSTLLFLAVLLACTPVHAQAGAPPEAGSAVPILNAWLASLLPVPPAESARHPGARQAGVASQPRAAGDTGCLKTTAAAAPLELSATRPTHDSNAP
jgi:hypothetical protein